MVPLTLFNLLACNGSKDADVLAGACGEDLEVFERWVWEPTLKPQCRACHVRGGVAGHVGWILTGGGVFTADRHLQLSETHDGVLTTVANAMGVSMDSFGVGHSGPVSVLY